MVFEQMLLMAILIKIYTMNLHILLHSDSMNLGHYLPNIQQDFKISPGYFFFCSDTNNNIADLQLIEILSAHILLQRNEWKINGQEK
jgi:hypothetical protein